MCNIFLYLFEFVGLIGIEIISSDKANLYVAIRYGVCYYKMCLDKKFCIAWFK